MQSFGNDTENPKQIAGTLEDSHVATSNFLSFKNIVTEY